MYIIISLYDTVSALLWKDKMLHPKGDKLFILFS